MNDGLERLASVTRLDRGDIEKILHEVQVNRRRLDSCQRHQFPDYDPGGRVTDKVACRHCGGKMSVLDIFNYVRGFRHAGGDPTLVMRGLPL